MTRISFRTRSGRRVTFKTNPEWRMTATGTRYPIRHSSGYSKRKASETEATRWLKAMKKKNPWQIQAAGKTFGPYATEAAARKANVKLAAAERRSGARVKAEWGSAQYKVARGRDVHFLTVKQGR